MYAVDDSAHRNRQLESKGKSKREKGLAGGEVGQVPNSVNDPVISQCNDISDFKMIKVNKNIYMIYSHLSERLPISPLIVAKCLAKSFTKPFRREKIKGKPN